MVGLIASSGYPSSSLPSVLGFQVHTAVPGFSTEALGFKLRPSSLYSSTLLMELSPKSSPQLQTPGSSNTYISLDLCSNHPDLEPQRHLSSAPCSTPLPPVSLDPPPAAPGLITLSTPSFVVFFCLDRWHPLQGGFHTVTFSSHFQALYIS